MPEFYIDASVLGTEQGLICDGNTVIWADEKPTGMLRWSNTLDTEADDSLNVALKLAGHDVKWRFEPRYIEALSSVYPSFRFNRTIPVPWHMLAPPKFAAMAVKRLSEDIVRAMSDMDPQAYPTFVKQAAFFRALQPARINSDKLEEYSKSGNRSQFLEAFKPGPDGFAQPVKYNRLQTEEHGGTKTGRLGIASGPPYLTLNREYRDIITSRWDDGEIWYLDYSALEPRTFQAHLGRKLDKDFYKHLAGNILGDSGKVKEAKNMFLSRFYGAGLDVLCERGECSMDQARRMSRHVDEDFGLKEMTAKLESEVKITGRIRNKFGMTISMSKDTPANVMFNNWVQSTANAVALLGFARICRAIAKAELDVIPVCSIHDAVVMDVHPRAKKYLGSLMKVGQRVPELGDIELAMHAERIS